MGITGGSCLRWIFESMKICPAYPIIIISLIIQRNLAQKIWAKREPGLTAVRLKRDPPVCSEDSRDIIITYVPELNDIPIDENYTEVSLEEIKDAYLTYGK